MSKHSRKNSNYYAHLAYSNNKVIIIIRCINSSSYNNNHSSNNKLIIIIRCINNSSYNNNHSKIIVRLIKLLLN